MRLYPILEYIFSPLILDHNVDYKSMTEDNKNVHYSVEKIVDRYTRKK